MPANSVVSSSSSGEELWRETKQNVRPPTSTKFLSLRPSNYDRPARKSFDACEARQSVGPVVGRRPSLNDP
jgi:hypothetical protein